jgi:ParB family transcriptional regulator, chromosome partitioning protein
MIRPEHPRKALGKGLGALLPTRPLAAAQAPAPAQTPAQPEPTPETIPVDLIDPNPTQPRRVFQPERLAELAQSIRQNGIIQPLVVRKKGGRYELVAGERRLRAAKLAQVDRVPAVVREIPDDRLLEVTLIENIQREDLNPIETATAFARLGQELNMDAEHIGRHTGKDRTTIINFLRLLQLPPDIQQMVSEGRLSASAGRCLCSLPKGELQRQLAAKIAAEEWPVRKVERMVQKLQGEGAAKKVEEVEIDPNVRAAIETMERALGTRVRIIEKARQRGKIEIDYYGSEDLDRIYNLIVRE